MPKKLRWGILSTARIATQLVRAISLSTQNELVAVASREQARAEAWAHEHKVAHAFGSYDELLASELIDAVYIPLPNGLHQEWAIRAAEQGKHILCEKSLANNAAAAQAMAMAARQRGVLLMEAFMYRFHPQCAQVQQMIAEGAIGDLRIIRATFGFNLTRPDDIRWDKALGGGSLLDVGCYAVNVSRLLAGVEPVAVQASATWTPGEVDSSLVGVMEFPNGVIAAIDSSFQTGGHQWVGISGTQGHIGLVTPFRMDENPTTILYDHGGKSETARGRGANEYHQMVEHFSDAVLNSHPLSYPPESSLAQMRVLDALAESARSRRRIEL
ncbi:MAG: Gfo/Idh/MocA family oxidoreductase [Anaerolineae bacterium]